MREPIRPEEDRGYYAGLNDGAPRKKKRGGFGRKIARFFGNLIITLVLLAGCALGLNYILEQKDMAFAEQMSEVTAKLEEALEFKEKLKVSDAQVEEKLLAIGELATSAFEYSGEKTIENTRQMMGVNIPGTTNRVKLVYNGVIKVGYEVSEIEYSVDQDSKLIIFDLPVPKVLDNYIKLDGLQCTDNNNILNPIGSEDMIGYFTDIEKEELKSAIDKGIYQQAEEKLRSIIVNFMAAFPEYSVVFA